MKYGCTEKYALLKTLSTSDKNGKYAKGQELKKSALSCIASALLPFMCH
jgi:hypothetical protein